MSLGPLMARFSRPPTRERLLQSPQRQRILDHVEADPGLTLGDLKARVGVGWGTLYHHVERMSEAALLRSVVVGRRHVVFPAASPRDDVEAAMCGILRGKTALRLAVALTARPRQSILDLSTSLGLSPRAVYYHVKRMVDAGLLTSSSPTRHFNLIPHPRLQVMLEDGFELDDDEP